MSDLSLQLQQAASQLSVSSYFDTALFRREMELLYQRGPRYVGHANWVPHAGDYYALPQEQGGRALLRAELDFSGMVLDHVELHHCNYNWKTFIEVYLEDYHVGPFHPGLGNFVTCDDLRWEFKRDYSVQTVGVANRLGKPGSDVYKRWHKALMNYRSGEPPKYGAIWLTYYP